MEKALFVKTEGSSFNKEQGLPQELYAVDKLCHGLLTQAIFKGFLEGTLKELLCLRPERGPFDVVFLAGDLKAILDAKSSQNFPELKSYFSFGGFEKADLQKLKKHFPNLEEWTTESP